MAPLFAVFDCDYYARIIRYHLADIQQYPPDILKCLEAGAFVVSITMERWKAVALDEARNGSNLLKLLQNGSNLLNAHANFEIEVKEVS